MDTKATAMAESSVIAVGAGPVGMSAALTLRARGVPVSVLEANPEDRDRWYSSPFKAA